MIGPRNISLPAAVIAAGLLLLGAASALAVPGPSGRGSAAVAQYGGTPETPTTPTTPVSPPAAAAPTQPSLTPPATGDEPARPDDPTPASPDGGGSDRAGDPGASRPSRDTPVEEVARRVESGTNGGELPFTGMAIIPILAAGVLLLLTGALLRHRARPMA